MLRPQAGAATLLLSVLLTAIITLIVLAASNYTWFAQKIGSNQYRESQAYAAAMAGLEYGMKYFDDNHETITASTTDGFINTFTNDYTSTTLPNGARYEITFTNPIAYNYDLILVSSRGVSDDSSSARVVSQLIQSAAYLATLPQVSVISKGEIGLKNNTEFTNTQTNENILAGGSVNIENSATTVTSLGITSSAASTGADVDQNNSTLANTSNNELFATYFGVTPDLFKGNANTTLTRSSDTDYSTLLDGKTGEIIWIEQTNGDASINGNVDIGSAGSPVILVVNGDLSTVSNAKIYGVVVVLGSATTEFVGSSKVYGALITASGVIFKNDGEMEYSSTILNALQGEMTYFAKVPGSWKDF